MYTEIMITFKYVLNQQVDTVIRTSSSESQDQEEAACTSILRPT